MGDVPSDGVATVRSPLRHGARLLDQEARSCSRLFPTLPLTTELAVARRAWRHREAPASHAACARRACLRHKQPIALSHVRLRRTRRVGQRSSLIMLPAWSLLCSIAAGSGDQPVAIDDVARLRAL